MNYSEQWNFSEEIEDIDTKQRKGREGTEGVWMPSTFNFSGNFFTSFYFAGPTFSVGARILA